MKTPLQSARAVGSAASSAPAQRKAGLKTITDNRPSAIAQRKLQGVVQRKDVAVGFDGQKNEMAYASAGDRLQTVGLANCIAIVATDSLNRGSVMRHFDTMHSYTGTQRDCVSGDRALVFNTTALQTVRGQMISALRTRHPDATINFHVSLGKIWSNLDPNSNTWAARHNLIQQIVAVFGVEPSLAASTATYDVASASLSE